jgi:hypothetical protein
MKMEESNFVPKTTKQQLSCIPMLQDQQHFFMRLYVSPWNMAEQLLCTATNDTIPHAQFPTEHKKPTQTYSS